MNSDTTSASGMANSWSTGGESVIGSGRNSEYGNAFDTMGSAKWRRLYL
jgi:hypothetical protein